MGSSATAASDRGSYTPGRNPCNQRNCVGSNILKLYLLVVMSNLAFNQGPEDALLFDQSKSYFMPVGYTRSSNFQVEYRDIDHPGQGNLGQSISFTIPKAADLLGPIDLMVEFTEITNGKEYKDMCTTLNDGLAIGWVESLGYAMIDYMEFGIGSNQCERITGDQLYILNELTKNKKARAGEFCIGKTGPLSTSRQNRRKISLMYKVSLE